MNDIQLVNLRSQYDKMQEEIDGAVLDVMRSCAFINGPAVQAFQKDLEEYLNVKHVIPCANGTDALQIALMALGLKPGDEVITTSFTYVATVEVIALLQLTPVFVEVDPDTFTMDLKSFEAAITHKTKAVVPVHLYGQCADMDGIMKIANANNIFVIEDTAQAIGANYTDESGNVKKAGTIGDVGCTSFFPSKNLGCYGDGGALFTNNDDLAATLRMVANHGQSKKYYHDIIGINSRLDSIQAAILGVKLKYLDSYSSARQKAANKYNSYFENCPGLSIPKVASYTNHVYHQYTLKIEGLDQSELMDHLNERNIPCNIYYPVPVHLQKGYASYGFKKGDLKLTEELCENVISLPMHTELEDDQLEFIGETLSEFARSYHAVHVNNN